MYKFTDEEDPSSSSTAIDSDEIHASAATNRGWQHANTVEQQTALPEDLRVGAPDAPAVPTALYNDYFAQELPLSELVAYRNKKAEPRWHERHAPHPIAANRDRRQRRPDLRDPQTGRTARSVGTAHGRRRKDALCPVGRGPPRPSPPVRAMGARLTAPVLKQAVRLPEQHAALVPPGTHSARWQEPSSLAQDEIARTAQTRRFLRV
jgi:hypothetical protein